MGNRVKLGGTGLAGMWAVFAAVNYCPAWVAFGVAITAFVVFLLVLDYVITG